MTLPLGRGRASSSPCVEQIYDRSEYHLRQRSYSVGPHSVESSHTYRSSLTPTPYASGMTRCLKLAFPLTRQYLLLPLFGIRNAGREPRATSNLAPSKAHQLLRASSHIVLNKATWTSYGTMWRTSNRTRECHANLERDGKCDESLVRSTTKRGRDEGCLHTFHARNHGDYIYIWPSLLFPAFQPTLLS